MNFMEKVQNKAKDNRNSTTVSIAFLGDSVTQGCFELYKKENNAVETIFDQKNAYCTDLAHLLSNLYPSVPINVINAGISGDNAVHGLERLERDVLRFHPDLVIVCFGLNDCMGGKKGIKAYENALKNIFLNIQRNLCDVIFMTPNMMNVSISPFLTDNDIISIAKETMKNQTGGLMDEYMEAARKVCNKLNVPVCDCYQKWKKLYENDVDTTELLANKINHPTREMHWMFAVSLLETILS